MQKSKRKTILKDAVVLLIAAVMVLSAATVTANTKGMNKIVSDIEKPVNIGRDVLFEDDFESYADFILDFPPWTQFDGDGAQTYGHNSYNWENEYYTGSYIIFNPSQTVPPMTDHTPHSGDKYAACFNAVLPATNDDWLFTPQQSASTFHELSFWARSYTDDYNLERFQVGVSTTDTDPASFTIISDPPYIEAPIEWTEYIYDLSDYSGEIYIGIHCVSNDAFWFMIDDFSVTGSVVPPLVADADGPYEAFEDEPIQFQGSAEGGEPPYSFHWDFGNGDTSDKEDPVYTYDEPGEYQVILTVTDDAETTDDNETTATINERPCCFEVLIPPGFGMGLKAIVTEICDESHSGVPWKFELSGGPFHIVIPISPLSGTTSFTAGESKTLKALLIFGIGSIQIKFTIGEYCDPTTVNALIIGPFVIVS